MGFTKTLARWIVDLRYADLPREVLPWVKAAVTDYFAVALAGCPAEGLKLVKKHVWSQYATGAATIVGNTPQEFAQIITSEIARWKVVAKTAGIKPIENIP